VDVRELVPGGNRSRQLQCAGPYVVAFDRVRARDYEALAVEPGGIDVRRTEREVPYERAVAVEHRHRCVRAGCDQRSRNGIDGRSLPSPAERDADNVSASRSADADLDKPRRVRRIVVEDEQIAVTTQVVDVPDARPAVSLSSTHRAWDRV